MEATELLQKALQACDGDELELAHRLGLRLSNANTQFQRWQSGKTKPDYETTIRLLEIAGATPQARPTPELAAEVAQMAVRVDENGRVRQQ